MRGVSDGFHLWLEAITPRMLPNCGPLSVAGQVQEDGSRLSGLCFIMSIFKNMFSAWLNKLFGPLFKSCIGFHREELGYM